MPNQPLQQDTKKDKRHATKTPFWASLPLVGKPLYKNGKRGKKFVGMADTLWDGYKAATKIGAWTNPPREILPKYIKAFCTSMTKAMGITVVPVEPIPQRHALWASNHTSWMDIMVMGVVSPAFFLSKADVEQLPIFGRLATAAGTLFINRGSGDSTVVAEQMAKFLSQGYSIMFYPEATTTNGKHIKRIYGKLLDSAMKANVPIQPTVLCYVNEDGELDDRISWYGNMGMGESLKNIMDASNVTAYVLALEPIDPTGKTRDQLTVLLRQRMENGLHELHKRVLRPDAVPPFTPLANEDAPENHR